MKRPQVRLGRALRVAGFAMRPGKGGHQIWHHASSGKSFTLASSPRDWGNTAKLVRSAIRRAERASAEAGHG